MSSVILARLVEIAGGLVALGILMRRLGRLLPRRRDSPFEAALARGHEPAPEVDEFASIRRAVDGVRFSAFDAHFTLRPMLRELAMSRLWLRRRIKLDSEPELAAGALGSEAFAFLREGRPAPPNFRRPMMGVKDMERIIEALESI